MYRVRILSDRVISYKHKYNNSSDNTIVPCAGFLEENNLKRFYFTCPKCLKTVMSGTDIYEKRALDCSCGNKINVDLNELVLKECDSCGKNNAFMKNKGKEQSCLACGKMLKLSLPEDILSGDDRAVFEQIKEILGKGLMTKIKIEKADSLFKTISAKGDFAGYANHINNYKEFNMYDSEYNSAVRIMNESSKKLEDAAKYNSKEELSELELRFSETAKRFSMLGGFKNSAQYRSVCEKKASECHFHGENIRKAPPAQSTAAPEPSASFRPSPMKQQPSRFDPIPPPPPPPRQRQGKPGSIKGVLIGAAAAVILGAILLVVVLNNGNEQTEPAINTSESQASSTDNTLSEVSSDGTDLDESYSSFVQLMNEGNYDLYSLNLYMDELKGYKDSDSIFEQHKAGFYEKFKGTAENYQNSNEFDLENTLEIIEGLHYFTGYENADELINKTFDKNLEFVDQEKAAGKYDEAAKILFALGDHINDYTDKEKLKGYFTEVADILSEKDPETAAELLSSVTSGEPPEP